MIFFTSEGKGLTSTSANHVANLAKELIRSVETSLNEMSFYSTNVSLINGNSPHALSVGVDDDEVEAVVTKLHDTAQAKSLIAWLREAIKAKERLIGEVKHLSLEDYAKLHDITLTEAPKLDESLTEDAYFASKSLEERCKYYELETKAATIGKAIHPEGAFADARKDLHSKIKKPHAVKGEGRDTLIYSYQPTVSEDVVEDVFFKLQKHYREVQAGLNAMKHECLKAVEESAVAARAKYTKEMAEWTNERSVLEAKRLEYVKRKAQELNALRIVIPEPLADIYQRVSVLGKGKSA